MASPDGTYMVTVTRKGERGTLQYSTGQSVATDTGKGREIVAVFYFKPPYGCEAWELTDTVIWQPVRIQHEGHVQKRHISLDLVRLSLSKFIEDQRAD